MSDLSALWVTLAAGSLVACAPCAEDRFGGGAVDLRLDDAAGGEIATFTVPGAPHASHLSSEASLGYGQLTVDRRGGDSVLSVRWRVEPDEWPGFADGALIDVGLAFAGDKREPELFSAHLLAEDPPRFVLASFHYDLEPLLVSRVDELSGAVTVPLTGIEWRPRVPEVAELHVAWAFDEDVSVRHDLDCSSNFLPRLSGG